MYILTDTVNKSESFKNIALLTGAICLLMLPSRRA